MSHLIPDLLGIAVLAALVVLIATMVVWPRDEQW